MEKKIHYVYAHIRKDTNTIFYIGIGTVNKNTRYKRAKSKYRRGSIWNHIVHKTEYYIKILIESYDYDFIKKHEIRLIAFWGKIKNNTGILSNIADGGEGNLGYSPSAIVVENQRQRMLGKKASDETKQKMRDSQLNKFVSERTREKLRQSKLGKSPSKKSDNRKKYLKHISSGLVFPSVRFASNYFNIRAGLLGRDIISGKNCEFVVITKEEFIRLLQQTNQIFPKVIRGKHTQEHNKKISDGNKGKIHSIETRNKLSISHKGRKFTAEHIQNISNYSASNIKVKNSLTGEIFKNITDAAKTINISSTALGRQLNKQASHCIFEYLDKLNIRKDIVIFKNIKTNELFLNIKEVANKENITKSAANARTERKSKNWNYIRIKMLYTDYLKLR